MTKQLKSFVEDHLEAAGIQCNGPNPWDIQVHNDNFYHRVVAQGSLGFGESYIEGWFESKQLDETIYRLMKSHLADSYNRNLDAFLNKLIAVILNKQSQHRAYEVGKRHYDLGNDLFQCMLDKRLTYSCAYWKEAKNLDEAQEAKLELVCQKLMLKPGMKVLDIGSGWGSFAKYAAERYGAQVVGVTVSQEQLNLAKELCKGLPVEFHFKDYRTISGQFDRIVSIGQMEHVGYKNYKTYMDLVARSLKDDGLFLLHTIGNNVSAKAGDPWIDKYIFPNGLIPSIVQLAQASENVFVMEDWHNFGAHYDKTLLAWYDNFNTHWPTLKEKYGESFYRTWKYYLLSCAGSFRARQIQLWQIVYSKRGVPGGYSSVR